MDSSDAPADVTTLLVSAGRCSQPDSGKQRGGGTRSEGLCWLRTRLAQEKAHDYAVE
jgi:hypothetical protein